MAEAFIVRRGGGGGSGGTLVVTSSGAGTVTVSNSALNKSYSKSVTAGGSVTFKGLKTGDWTVTVSNGTQTATRSVTINADYSVSVAYFSATILLILRHLLALLQIQVVRQLQAIPILALLLRHGLLRSVLLEPILLLLLLQTAVEKARAQL